MNPQYCDEYLADYYSKYLSEKPEYDKGLFYSHNFCLDLIEKIRSNKGSLLDVGCGYGHLISYAKNRGWQVLGFDIDCAAVERISKQINVKILCGDFTKLKFNPETFDVITMLHVIEHLKHPVEYLSIISKLIKKQGVFFLALPNIRSRAAITKFYLERLGFRKKWKGNYYDTAHHLWYFNPKSIKYILQKLGFKVVDIRSGRHVKPIKFEVKKYVIEKISDRILWRSTMLITTIKE
jgi:2-polyprenyl-3-methyl-5-hydroxy-6-metoxy-1,4-benzoquinol methylase